MVLSVPLAQASMTRGNSLAERLGQAPDSGITILGFPGEHGRPGSYFFGLGSEPAATACVQAVEAAIVDAKNPG